jgi:glutamate/tyrosine decarboxylase-like PLP-dependent enzyme
MALMQLPDRGRSRDELLDAIRGMQSRDVDWRSGRLFHLIYHAEPEIEEMCQAAHNSCFSLNALSPEAFPSLEQMETEVIQMVASMFHCKGSWGNITSGGTESNFLAVKTARDRARDINEQVGQPEVILPLSAHPSLPKAAHYLGMKVVAAELGDDYRVSVEAVSRALSERTVLIVGSAPCWPHGVIDPIVELSQLAKEAMVPLHVDSCVGGFILPFAESVGRPIPPFDFRLPGVCSMSADVHKFGYAPKGASVVVYRDESYYHYQPFSFSDWTGGLYTVPTFTGSRPGGPIAAAWAAMQFLGRQGYVEMTGRCLRATELLAGGIRRIEGLEVASEPELNIITFRCVTADIAAVAAGMHDRGWLLLLQADPGKSPTTLHMTVNPSHDRFAEEFLQDLSDVTNAAATGKIVVHDAVARYN